MNAAHRIRTVVRGTLVVLILVYTWFALASIAGHSIWGAPLTVLAAAFLIAVLVAVSKHARRS
jgi:hypothetical protein